MIRACRPGLRGPRSSNGPDSITRAGAMRKMVARGGGRLRGLCGAREGASLPVRHDAERFPAYGSETVVLSPVAEMLNVPVAVEAVYAYGELQPAGGGGTFAMNGPAVCPRMFVATTVS